MTRWRLLVPLLLLACASRAAEGDITLVISGQSEPPSWVRQADGSYQVTITTGKVSINKAAAAAPATAPVAAAAAPATVSAVSRASPAAAAGADTGGAAGSLKDVLVGQIRQDLDAKGKAAVENFKNYLVDMSVPTSPAFAALGASPETILQPKSPRDLAVSLAQALSDKSKLANGVGFDVAPYMLVRGATTTLGEYRSSSAVRLLWNTQLSFGAIKQDVDDGSITRVAAGASWVLLDRGDPRLSKGLDGCFRKAARQQLTIGNAETDAWVQEVLTAQANAPEGADPAPTPKMVAATDRLSTAYSACREAFKSTSWNSTRWTAGLAQAVHNRGGGTHAGTLGFWTTYSLNLDGDDDAADLALLKNTARSQVLFHYRHTNREEVASASDPRGFELRRGDLIAVGYKYGSDKRNVSAEASVQRGRFDTGGSETSRKLAIGGELMVTKDLWLVASIGGQGGQKNGNNSPFALAGLKFGSASESTGAFGK